MDEILGMFGSIGETESIPEIIKQFAAILAEIIKIITGLFNGELPDLGTSEPSNENTSTEG